MTRASKTYPTSASIAELTLFITARDSTTGEPTRQIERDKGKIVGRDKKGAEPIAMQSI